MPEVIRIRKGLNIRLQGKAEKIIVKGKRAELFGIKPTDFHGVVPRLLVKTGDRVKAGTALFIDKYHPEVKFTSPVSGTVEFINRGERRIIQEIVVKPDEVTEYEEYVRTDPTSLTREEVIRNILDSGLWPVIRQRPYNVIANPVDIPKAIFISAFDTAPLAPDYDFVLKDFAQELQAGINALIRIGNGEMHLGVEGEYRQISVFNNIKGVQVHRFRGPHPAGNVGTQIHQISPINKGEKVWVVSPQDVVLIGRLFITGHYDASKIVALTGPEVISPRYYKTISGSCVRSVTEGNIREGNVRIISGNALTGTQVSNNSFISYYDSQITVLPEGNHREFFGWLVPGLNKFSSSGAFMTKLMADKEYRIDTNLHGGKRSLMITGKFEKVFPFDIYPMQLIKAIIIEDIDQMEKLGIYEVVEEDFALCEFVDTSKTDIQAIVRKGLDLIQKEMN